MDFISRKEFLAQAGAGAAALLLPACLGSLTSCSPMNPFPAAPTNVDMTLDVSTGALSVKGGSLVTQGLIIARTTADIFIAVSVTCTHQGSNVQYLSNSNSFYCPNHGATFNSTGKVTGGPASSALAKYNTQLSGTSLRVFS